MSNPNEIQTDIDRAAALRKACQDTEARLKAWAVDQQATWDAERGAGQFHIVGLPGRSD